MPLSFIHTADLHLGRGLDHFPDNSLEIYEHLLKTIENTATRNVVDFILFAGDTFNSLDVDISIKKKFLDLIKNLGKHNIEIFYACGNHDFFQSKFYKPFLNEKNFHIFPEYWQSYERDEAVIHGYSFNKAAFKKKMLHDYSPEVTGKTNIFCFHTNISEVSSQHENYAPSSLQEFEKFPLNSYFGLGHIHQHNLIREGKHTIVYPGSPLPTRIIETGEKGFYLVKQNSNKTFEKNFIKSGAEIAELTLDISGVEDFFEIDEMIKESMDNYTDKNNSDSIIPEYLSFKVRLSGNLSPELKKELVKNISENYFEKEVEGAYVWDNTRSNISPKLIAEEKGLFEAMVKTYYNMNMDEVALDNNITDLLEHSDNFNFDKAKNDALLILYSMLKGDK
ncbi:MAG: DNA repair exonuclease [Flexistipes sinusarabici]|uniref:DNA repair exonuclease n=1 Tax=Flexistipes sinusarabici TaxID=2352 RepID=A0A5D0MIX3_FLESI|nr:DNA repair exonuclease [Flexistipes sinusarabici]TYB32926.1 MAG: DNA repair exonuclease [Flexistipes sinusarabici]